MFKKVPLFLILLFSLTVKAQNPAHYLVGKDVFDGVHLYSIIQDKDNSIWITSNKGLYHYNGVSFTHHLPKSAKNYSLFGLTKNAEGDIFCFNLNGQIYKVVNKKLQLYHTLSNKYLSGGMRVFFDSKNNLFVISDNGAVMISEDKKDEKHLKNAKIIRENDTIYFGSNLKGSTKMALGNYDKKANFKYYSKLYDRPDNIFFVDNKVYYFNRTTYSFFNLKSNTEEKINFSFLNNLYFGLYSSSDSFWFSDYKNGVYKVPHKNMKQHLNPTKWFKDYYISGAMTDVEGNTWLLTFNKGIIVIPNLNIINQNNLFSSHFKTIRKSGNQLYFSTSNGGIYNLINNEAIIYQKTNNDRVEHFSVFREKKIVVTNLGIYKNAKKIPLTGIGFTRNSFIVDNTVYLAMFNGLGAYNLKTKQFKKLTNNRTYDICYDKETQKIWISSSIGLTHFKNGKETVFKYKGKPLNIGKFTKVDKEIWTYNREGVYVFKKDNLIHQFTTKNGLLSNHINNIRYEYPYVYLASQKGLQQYNISTKTFKNFTRANGLTKSITDFEVLNNTVYALNSNGLMSFSFNFINDANFIYQTQITDALANGIKKITNKDVLSPNENNIEFSFLTTSFKYQKELKYQYQLKGYEKKPTLAKENQYFVKYPNLPSGTYTFVVDSFVNDKQNKSASLTFTIKEHWYHSLWFKTLVIALGLLVIYTIYKVRLNTILQKQDKERMKKLLAESSLTSLKAQMNPHFMFNAMNSIQSLVLEGKRYEAYEYISQISNFVRKNLKMSDVAFISFEKELEFSKMYLNLEKLRFKDTFTYTIENRIKKTSVKIPSMIIQPFLENAVKHGLLHRVNNRKLSVVFKQEGKIIFCIITDNGIGREASVKLNKNKHASFSTGAIKNRFHILKQYYKIDIGFEYEDLIDNANKPTGTRVTIKIPFSNE